MRRKAIESRQQPLFRSHTSRGAGVRRTTDEGRYSIARRRKISAVRCICTPWRSFTSRRARCGAAAARRRPGGRTPGTSSRGSASMIGGATHTRAARPRLD